MLVRKLDPTQFFNAYGVDLQLLYPLEGQVDTPFGAAWAVIPPGGRTKLHNHQEGETFFILRGRGEMTIGDESTEVGPGHVVFQTPFDKHTLVNLSDDEELLFLTVWWEDPKLWPKEPVPGEAAAAEVTPRRRRALVTAAPPTPNGDLHLGHLSGPYLAADVLTRALRLQGIEAAFACGSDDNSEYVKSKGRQLGLSPREAADRFVASIERSIALSGIDMAAFVHPDSSPHHVRLTEEFFRTLHARGKLVERTEPCAWSEAAQSYLFEPWIAGTCPHCGAGVVGNTCEDCGRVNDARVLEPRCTRTDTPATQRPVRRLIFPLSQYGPELRAYWERTAMRPHLRSFCEKLLADGLPDVAITHPTDWGIPVPLAGWEDQRLYVWFEMAPRYFSYAQHVLDRAGEGEDWTTFWRTDVGADAEIVQCFGFDNSFYYAALLPAMFLAFDPAIRLPKAFVTNEFYQLEGKKFSTSRQHAIWINDFLARVPADVVRFYLSSVAPETEATNFSLSDFLATVERELVGRWGGWLEGLFAKVHAEQDGKVPSTGDWTAEQRAFLGSLERLTAEVERSWQPESFSPQQTVSLASELVRAARRFGKAEDHWLGVPERSQERRTGLALEMLAAKVLALVVAPVMPVFAGRLWQSLGFAGAPTAADWAARTSWVPGGQATRPSATAWFPSAVELRSAVGAAP
jgi:methionyl-tRNA synthetase